MSDESNTPTAEAAEGTAEEKPRGPKLFGRFGFWIVAFPFIYYLITISSISYLEDLRIAAFEGTLHDHEESSYKPDIDIKPMEEEARAEGKRFLFGLLPMGESTYPHGYKFAILTTAAIVVVASFGYWRIPFRISWLGFAVGAVGIVVWIGLAHLNREYLHLSDSDGRPAFNPFVELAHWDKGSIWDFILLRFFGLVVIVPIVEEFFIRCFLIRYVDSPDWDEQPLADAKTFGWLSPTIYGLATHLTEPLAAVAWFSLITWLHKKTGNVWDCVVAHAVTNLLLGIYILKYDAWHLW